MRVSTQYRSDALYYSTLYVCNIQLYGQYNVCMYVCTYVCMCGYVSIQKCCALYCTVLLCVIFIHSYVYVCTVHAYSMCEYVFIHTVGIVPCIVLSSMYNIQWTVLYTVLYCMYCILYCTVCIVYCTVLYVLYTVLYCMYCILYCTICIVYCTVLYVLYTVLYCMCCILYYV